MLLILRWRPKYQTVIKAVGRTVARMRYEDFDIDARKIAGKLSMVIRGARIEDSVLL